MKKCLRLLLSISLAVVTGASALLFTACNWMNEINYHSVIYFYDGDKGSVDRLRKGDSYIIPVTPSEIFGYTFDGWYDERVGGNKCADSNGKSLQPLKSNDNLILYAQFLANSYTVKLDYGGEQVNAAKTIDAVYDQVLPQLPAEFDVAGKDFNGWYTLPQNRGVEVADSDGVSRMVFNRDNFAFDRTEFVLYAGFTTQTRTLTFKTAEGALIKTIKADYGSDIASSANSVRVDGKGVLRWRESIDGKVTDDREFTAEEYAPVIELDLCGGIGTTAVIAKAGAAVYLPVPKKSACDFLYWVDEDGKKYSPTVMPASGASLKAVWQPKIVFDSNGGSEVSEIAENAGTAISLPYPTRAGYLFAGWYTNEEKLYSGKTMPADGLLLKAGWYREKTGNMVVLGKNRNYCPFSTETALRNELTIDLSKLLPEDFHGMIKVQGSVMLKHKYATLSSPYILTLAFYNDKAINASTELMKTKKFSVTSGEYEKFNFAFEGYLVSNKIYAAAGSQMFGNSMLGMAHYGYYNDMNIELNYADTSMLYL